MTEANVRLFTQFFRSQKYEKRSQRGRLRKKAENFTGYFVFCTQTSCILLLLLFYQQAKHLSFVLKLENGDSNRCSHRRCRTISKKVTQKPRNQNTRMDF